MTLKSFFSTLKSLSFMACLCLLATGCQSTSATGADSREQAATISALNDEVARLNRELDAVFASRDNLAVAKEKIEQDLESDIAQGNMTVTMQARGLVVTVLDRVLFDSGSTHLKNSALSTLQSVGEVLQDKVQGHMIFVEGHTDSVPITHSQWRSNWELSTARSTEVVHFFTEQAGINPKRLAAVGYGPYQPIASNDTGEGRQKNRRVEIVVSPQKIDEMEDSGESLSS